MRILLIALFGFGDTNIRQQLKRSRLGFGLADLIVQRKGFLNLLTYGLQRVKAGHRILEHHCYALAANLCPILFLLECGQIIIMIIYMAIVYPAVIVQQSHKGLGEHAFAGTGFADYRKAFALVKLKADAAHGSEHLAAQVELDHKIFNGKDRIIVIGSMFYLMGIKRRKTRLIVHKIIHFGAYMHYLEHK